MLYDTPFPFFEQIPGFENYLIDCNGNIVTSFYKRELRHHFNEKGYRHAFLYKDKKKHCIKVHRIVAKLFVDNPRPNVFKEVNHIDGNKANCDYRNLEWCDRKMNMRHAFANGLKISPRGKSHQNSIQLKNTETGVIYESMTDAAKKTGMTLKQITNRLKKDNSIFIKL